MIERGKWGTASISPANQSSQAKQMKRRKSTLQI